MAEMGTWHIFTCPFLKGGRARPSKAIGRYHFMPLSTTHAAATGFRASAPGSPSADAAVDRPNTLLLFTGTKSFEVALRGFWRTVLWKEGSLS